MDRKTKRVVITGIGLITPIGIGKKDFWESNLKGASGTRHLEQFDEFNFSSKSFGYVQDFNPQERGLNLDEIRRMDRVTQFGVVCADQAVEDAKIDWSKINKKRVGTNIANAVAGTKFMDEEFLVVSQEGKSRILPDDVSPYAYSKSMPNTTTNEIAYRYGLNGICITSATGCTAGIDSVGFCYDSVRYGDLDLAICGASEAPITPITVAAFEAINTLSTHNSPPKGSSRPFDNTRNGFVLAEGAAIIILEELEHALKRGAYIYAEIIGFASVNNAIHMTGLHPDGLDVGRSIRLAIQEAGIDKTEIEYINAHGSGTKQNDISETAAYKKVFGDYAYEIPISSTKSMTGHPLGAASAIEIAVCCLVLENNFVPPTINYKEQDERCDLDYMPNVGKEKDLNIVLTNASGFSGIHSAMLFSKYDYSSC